MPGLIALRIGLWLLLTFVFWGSANAADINVSVSRNPVGLNESFQIIFSADEMPDGSPDFSPLETSFDILNQQRSSNMSWINGKSSRNEQWHVSVMAKQAGELLIPPIAFGSDSSKPLKVTVTDTPDSKPNNNADIFLDVQASPESPYVQSQIVVTLRIYFRVQITRSSLSDLDIKDALIEQLGEDSTFRTQINGLEYGVLERKYAIFPQQSGVFTIPAVTLTTEVAINSQPRFNGFFSRQPTETRRISSKPITVTVKPVPKNFTDPAWLSADSLQLTEQWSATNLQTKVGEPLTRTITLTAKGSTVGQLPELFKPNSQSGIKTYPDQPALKEDKAHDGLIAIREEKIAYIPSQAGDYVLPAIKINWFNSKTQQVEVAELPEVTIHAMATGSSQSLAAPAQPQNQIIPEIRETQQQSSTQDWFWPAFAAFLALGWLSNILWLYRRRVRVPEHATQKAENPVNAAAPKMLKVACQKNDPHAAKQALIQWGRQKFSKDSLSTIASCCPPALAEAIIQLNETLYAANTSDWNGQSLWNTFDQADLKAKKEQEQDDGLQPLYRL